MQNYNEQEKKLQFFLIKEFMITLVLVSVVEYVILLMVNHVLMPFVLRDFFPHYDKSELINSGTIIILAFLLLAAFLVGIIEAILPDQIKRPVSWLSNLLQNQSNRTMLTTGSEDIIDRLNGLQQFLLFMIILAMFVLIVLPYFVGALHFTRITVKEFNKIAEMRVKARKDFEKRRNLMLSDIAHDLRTPITTMAGYSKALSDGMVSDEKKQEYLDAIMAKSERVNELIQLLFDYVKLDSDGFSLNRQPTDIYEIVRECGAIQYSDIEDAGMELEVDIPEKEMKLSVDKIQLSRVITNLITNAIKHNEKGDRIALVVDQYDDRIQIMVADSGKKIPDEKAEHLFEPFIMGDESRNSRGGSGLGLSIAKKIVEMHGYNIRLIQQPDIVRFKYVDKYVKMFLITIPLND